MKIIRILTWLVGAAFLLMTANHYFNPNFTAHPHLILAISSALFVLIGILEYQATRKKNAAFYILLSLVSCIALISFI